MKAANIKGMIVGVAAIVGLAVAPVTSAYAQSSDSQMMYQANLQQLNGSGDSGTAMVTVNGNEVTVKVDITGASPNLPHAQHFHIGGDNHTCPGPEADTNDSGLISSVEGVPSYGAVKVSLTTTGAVDAESSLAVDRFPVADENGNISYERTFTLPEGVTPAEIEDAVVVSHGISELFGDEAAYDGDPRSSLDDSLPLEATVPASCGALSMMPDGGVATGGGSTAGVENGSVIVLGIAGLAAAGVLTFRNRSLGARS